VIAGEPTFGGSVLDRHRLLVTGIRESTVETLRSTISGCGWVKIVTLQATERFQGFSQVTSSRFIHSSTL